ncbi:hypothetical protein F8568_037335 [Actinomadura sp. LD22]|uniref:WCX domain-containing protein n=1 Tax=Actinomadura physcomitrii TaxID=2650748 RepID=A0A6I4MP85_9ACTN|nr:WYL domain-containing protein [Actinomadura physcomitrii]MWA05924.1 hypothetical protein [Actinomadura physcomitrii]
MRTHRPGGGRADRRPPRALAAAAALATAAAVLDVLAGGPLRHLDQRSSRGRANAASDDPSQCGWNCGPRRRPHRREPPSTTGSASSPSRPTGSASGSNAGTGIVQPPPSSATVFSSSAEPPGSGEWPVSHPVPDPGRSRPTTRVLAMLDLLLETSLEQARRRIPATVAALTETTGGVVMTTRAEHLDGMARMLAGLGWPFVIRRPAELRGHVRDPARRPDEQVGRAGQSCAGPSPEPPGACAARASHSSRSIA